MKIIIVLISLCVASFAAPGVELKIREDAKDRLENALKELEAGNTSIVDELPNIIFDLIASVIGNSDLDPISLPDLEVPFETTPIWITYRGVFTLTNGQAGGFSAIERNGDAEVSVSLINRSANIRLPITFEALTILYDYGVTINGLNIDGIFSGSFQGITSVLDIDVNLVNMGMTLNDFSLTAERFVFRFEGNPISDWLVNILVNIVAEFVREPIMSAVESVFGAILGAIFGGGSEPAALLIQYL